MRADRSAGRGALAAALGLVVAAALAAAVPPARADAPLTLDRLLAGFASMPGLHARFVEEKRLAMLAVPIRSEGEIWFAPPGRLLRRVTSPTPSEARITGGRLVLESPTGREEIDLGQNAVVEGFVDTFRNVLAGDRAALERTYRATLSTDGDRWTLRLAPRSDALRRFLDELVMEGEGQAMRSMRMVEANGDVTVTTFTDVDPRRRLSDAEVARLFGDG